ncbi:hypothetical protein GGS23DRAFT_569647 [Durotheca rogersii]|uniref:uncharacterized protein n=1 Tax=Durotheca rogersii TaxID=419775 RepID=UPI00222122AF|nr:uncharacterized protein GGS23DRAFT_569647 [Durotheca rogersii]KAI5862826.1 hypothetical protein GGS23DRAFT_569647 [Durotheca rogersii]
MLAARDQENLAFSRQNTAALKQQQGQVKRQLQPNTPGARYANTPIKVPLNDENGTHAAGPAKSVLGAKSRGNENTLTSQGAKTVKKANLATPMAEPHSRAPLGNKTTNAKTNGRQAVNVKSAVRDVEKSQAKAPTTIRSRQKQPQAELQKLQIHAEGADPLSEEEVEYCPPRPKDLPYESDVFPDGALTFDALKPENLFRGYYDYYYNPVDEHGVPLADKQLEERNKKAMEECDRLIKEDMDKFEWSIQDELESGKNPVLVASKGAPDASLGAKKVVATKGPSTVQSRKAAGALAMDDTTKSLQRKVARSMEASKVPVRKAGAFAIPSFKRQPNPPVPSIPRKTSLEIETNSRTTIGYSKGRSTASILAQGTASMDKPAPKAGIPRHDTTLSRQWDKIITPARFAQTQISAAEDQEWKERVPFLSIFNPGVGDDGDDDDDFELVPGGMPSAEEDEEFVMKLAD